MSAAAVHRPFGRAGGKTERFLRAPAAGEDGGWPQAPAEAGRSRQGPTGSNRGDFGVVNWTITPKINGHGSGHGRRWRGAAMAVPRWICHGLDKVRFRVLPVGQRSPSGGVGGGGGGEQYAHSVVLELALPRRGRRWALRRGRFRNPVRSAAPPPSPLPPMTSFTVKPQRTHSCGTNSRTLTREGSPHSHTCLAGLRQHVQ